MMQTTTPVPVEGAMRPAESGPTSTPGCCNTAGRRTPGCSTKVLRWLARHPRFVFHFTVDLVLLAQCDRDLLRQAHPAAAEARRVPLVALQTAINGFIEAHNRKPKPFVWTADPNAIIAAAKRGYQALESIH
jgi:hypothetical protein